MDKPDRRLLGWLLLGIGVLVGGLYVTGYLLASDRLPQGTTVAGVDVGGLRPGAAEAALRAGLTRRAEAPIVVQVQGRRVRLRPERVGLGVDFAASIDQVPVGRSWNVADMWETVVGGQSYDAVVVTTGSRLRERLSGLAARVRERPVEGAVRFDSTGPRPTYARNGTRLDVDRAVAAVQAAYPTGAAVSLRVGTDRPVISSTDVTRAMEDFANPAMSGPVVFEAGRRQVVLQPEDYAAALSLQPRAGRLEPQVDAARLMRLVQPVLQGLARPPRDATVRIVRGRPVVVPGRKGMKVDRRQVAATFLRLAARSGDRRAKLPMSMAAPALTAAEVRDLGITEKVSEFTTYYPHAEYRNVNIGRAAELIDGTILQPGETFSLNRTVGERTAENGFTRGYIISDGIFREDFGGGVSQVATTTFNAAFFAGLKDVEHKTHSFYIDRYPVGREATVAWPSVDLRFQNDTRYGVLIQAVLRPSTPATEGALTVRMWSTKVWDITSRTSERYDFTAPDTRYLSGPGCVPNTGYSGFSVDVTRVFRKVGQKAIDHTERMHTTYTPSDTVICR